jgi:hypothetical protein
MSAEELGNALRFEVETLSGIEIDDIELAYTLAEERSSTETRFWLNVVRRDEFEQFAGMMKVAGVRAFEVGHPAGMIGGELPGSQADEIWGSNFFRFRGNDHRLTDIQRTPEADALANETVSVAVKWSEEGEGQTAMAPLTAHHNLCHESGIRQWLQQVISRLSSGPHNVPLIQRQRLSTGLNWRPIAATALAGLVFIGCVLHRNWLLTQTQALEIQTSQLTELTERKLMDDAENIKLLEQQSELEKESLAVGTDLKRIQFFHDFQTGRLPKLLNLLSELRTPELVVQELLPDPKGTVVAGISMNSESAPLLANRLRLLAVPLGWKVSAATQEGEQKMISGGPWAFQILLEDTNLFDPPATDSGLTPPPSTRNKF